jgi:hypothetical protein
MPAITWQGTEHELARLHMAVDRNCDCAYGMVGLPPLTCAAHTMLNQQNVLDHLLYVLRTRRVFITREFYAVPVPAPSGPEHVPAQLSRPA